jgi:uncharacterized membrane protein YccC
MAAAPGGPGSSGGKRLSLAAILASPNVEVGLRAGFAVAVPLILLLLVGRLDLAAYATFGAFTALYGRNEPYRIRVRSLTVGGGAVFLSIVAGTVVAALGEPFWLLVVLLLVVVGGGTLLVTTFQLVPPQALFFVFALLVCAAVPTPVGEVVPRLALALATAVFAWLLTMSGWALRKLRPRGFRGLVWKDLARRPKIDRGALTDPLVWLTVGQNVVGVVIAGGIALTFGLGHVYWAVVSLVAVIPPARAAHSISRSIHRVVGTIVGVGATALLLFWSPPPLFLILVIVACQVFAEILVARHYGSALVFITPMALAVSHLATPTPLNVLVVDRVLETVLGAGVGMLLVLGAKGVERTRLFGRPPG